MLTRRARSWPRPENDYSFFSHVPGESLQLLPKRVLEFSLTLISKAERQGVADPKREQQAGTLQFGQNVDQPPGYDDGGKPSACWWQERS